LLGLEQPLGLSKPLYDSNSYNTIKTGGVEALMSSKVTNEPAYYRGSGELGATDGFPLKLIVDTDAGVDDAAAIAWLLSLPPQEVEILGITTVRGNTSPEYAANNVLTLLDAAGRTDVPVMIGSEPLDKAPSQYSMSLHGPDGLWYVGFQNPHDLSGLSNNVPKFYRQQAVAHPGATILALGPLSNIAKAIQQYPDEMRQVGQIIVVGGTRQAVPKSTDFNIWQDPEALNIVLNSGIPLKMALAEAVQQFVLSQEDLEELAAGGNPVFQVILPAIQAFAQVKSMGQGEVAAALPDVVAAVYATQEDLGGPTKSALVHVTTDEGPHRGQTIIGDTFGARVMMIASEDELNALNGRMFSDPSNPDFNAAMHGTQAILMRESDNATIVDAPRIEQMHEQFMQVMVPLAAPADK
jgi:inosine-uridine nucleoside N-ribohydrolase